MSSVNRVIIVGRLGQDPEVRQFQNGGSVTNISVATSERWTDKNTGEQKEQTEWHRVSLFNRLGETASRYLRKGSMVYIEGSLNTRKYTDQQGIERYSTEIRATNMVMLGGNTNNQNTHQDPMAGGQPYHGGYNAQGNHGYNGYNNSHANQNFNQQGSQAQWGAQNNNFEQNHQAPQGGFNPQYPNNNSVQGLGHAPQGMGGGMNHNVANQGMSGNQFITPPSAVQGAPKGSGAGAPSDDDMPF